MKKYTVLIIAILVMLGADLASAWSWEKRVVTPPAVAGEVTDESKSGEREEAKPVGEKGFWPSIKETGRDIGGFFKGVGKDAKESGKQVPGEAKKEGKAVGKGFKDAGKTIGKESKKGAKSVGKGFKRLGKDIRDSTRKAFVREQEESGD